MYLLRTPTLSALVLALSRQLLLLRQRQVLGGKDEESLSQAAVHSVLGTGGGGNGSVCLSLHPSIYHLSMYRESHQSVGFMIKV